MDLQNIKNQLAKVLSWKYAHSSFEEAVSDVPYEIVHVRPEGVPYSIWELVFHCRIVQLDILEYSKNPHHVSPKWPDEYWPKIKIPLRTDWEEIVSDFIKELNEMKQYIENPDTDLFVPFPNGSGHNLFREVLLLADHTAYHTGQIVLVRKLLNHWS